jgi:hypothetical protein
MMFLLVRRGVTTEIAVLGEYNLNGHIWQLPIAIFGKFNTRKFLTGCYGIKIQMWHKSRNANQRL